MPYLLLTLAALFWGGNYVVGHVLVQGVDPILMTEARWALTALLLGLLYRRQIAGSRHLLRANAPAVVVLTLCGQVSFPLTLYIGLQTTSALNAAIYMSATPSMVLLINRLFFRDPVSGRNWLGVAFSTLGVMILLFQGNPLHAASLHSFAVGDLWAMGSALSWGALLFAVTSEGPPYPGEWLCRRQLAAWRADPAAHRRLLADAPSGPGLGSLARAVLPQRPGVSGNFPVMAGLSVLE
ncbi:drug/metabolite transporter permease [Klebsiella pneumoniae]|nr:drug/metabolite transporter permease [Klebsiella pneumoniae]